MQEGNYETSRAALVEQQIINHPRLHFKEMEKEMKKIYWQEVVRPMAEFAKWVDEQKYVGKDLVRAAAGARAAPATPQCRRYKTTTLIERLRTLKIDLGDDENFIVNEQGNKTQSYRSHQNQSQADETPHFEPKLIKREAMSPSSHLSRSATRTAYQMTPSALAAGDSSAVIAASRHKQPPVNSPDLFDDTEDRTLAGTPRIRRALRSAKKPLTLKPQSKSLAPNTEAVKAAIAEQVAIRNALSPVRKSTRVQKTNKATGKSARSKREPSKKRSEIVRALEAKTNAVIMNKEEIVREKADRARRGREDREIRVRMNNRKKEEAEAERARQRHQRELEIAELRRLQASPSRAFRTPKGSRANTPSSHRCGGTQPPNSTKKVPYLRPLPSTVPIDPFDPTAELEDIKKEHAKSIIVDCQQVGLSKPEDNLNPFGIKSPENVKEVENLPPASNFGMADSSIQRSPSVAVNPEINKVEDGHNRPGSCTTVNAEEQHKVEECEKQDADVIGLVNSSKLSNKNLNVTSQSCYEITPAKTVKPSTADNYGIDDLSSDDETDDEEKPRKQIPKWAQPANVRRIRREQRRHPPMDIDEFFGVMHLPDLVAIFSRQRASYKKRTSSAVWSSPLTNPRVGQSKFFALQHEEE